MAHKQELW